ncbi:MAG: hypothetical protein BWX80_01519 [Candidatus Hydrogenedentes bacterium ADurb.Bin101]|nr:MAG: hypothetical protein BWX80_01519 [Candidatus Hydrogenedentes bacterium ADurb.Bin101]
MIRQNLIWTRVYFYEDLVIRVIYYYIYYFNLR